MRLRITEIFLSLQGESSLSGLPTVFIRLTGCPLRCQYCDTAYAFSGGTQRSLDDIITEVSSYQTRHVTVTGGEPLAQKNCLPLLEQLCDQGFFVSLETSGAIDISKVDPRVKKVMDLKTPASLEMTKNNYENLSFLNKNDELKFVICDRSDYNWAKQTLLEYELTDRCEILFSAMTEIDTQDISQNMTRRATQLANWIIEDKLPIRFQIQLHKLLWHDARGH